MNLTFNTVPTGLTLYLDGIAKATPFVYDTLVGFNHTIEARNQSAGSTTYTFASWSDGGAQQHAIVVPSARADLHGDVHRGTRPRRPRPSSRSSSATPQTPQSTRDAPFVQARRPPATLNIVAIGWNDADLQHRLGDRQCGQRLPARDAHRTRDRPQPGDLLREEHRGGAARRQHRHGAVRHGRASSPTSASPSTAAWTGQPVRCRPARPPARRASPAAGPPPPTPPSELLLGAGMTSGAFNGAGAGYTTRIITQARRRHRGGPRRHERRHLQRDRSADRHLGHADGGLQGRRAVGGTQRPAASISDATACRQEQGDGQRGTPSAASPAARSLRSDSTSSYARRTCALLICFVKGAAIRHVGSVTASMTGGDRGWPIRSTG